MYPIFLRLDRLRILVVGAGEVGYEKLYFLLRSSPNARITIVAPWMGDGLQNLLGEPLQRSTDAVQYFASPGGGELVWRIKKFVEKDVRDFDLIIAATNFRDVNHQVWRATKKWRKVVNVADTPDLCDFYLGSIVTRGPLKVAISTNGQSPTFAKRFRQWLESQLPESETAQLLDNLKVFRDRLKGDFSGKVKALNNLTQSLLREDTPDQTTIQGSTRP